MKKLLVIFLSLIFLIGCGAVDGQESAKFTTINSKEAVKLMEEESGYVIVDVRTPEEYKSGHIPDAMNIPNDDIGNVELDAIPDKEQLILLYCRSGTRSQDAASKLAEMGYTKVVNFGGISDWDGEIVTE